MFTWNLQFVSKKRLADTLSQLMIDSRSENDILIRIHTAIHTAEEAVDLAAFIKGIVPGAGIVGTSTSAIILGGKLIHDQCIISITQMTGGSVHAARVPTAAEGRQMMPAESLYEGVREKLVREDTKLLLAFFTETYRDVERFTAASNRRTPAVPMIGGVADWNDIIGNTGFVFDENGWSGQDAIFAALDGGSLESFTGFATGVQTAGEPQEITKVKGDHILEVDGIPGAEYIHAGIGKKICLHPHIGFYFPLAYAEEGADVPFVFGYYGADGIGANHNVTAGRKIRRGFFYDRKVVSDNRSLFNRAESFEKAESVFAYTCRDRYRIYPNCVRWELSVYGNSNISGCLTQGEISGIGGRNVFTNCAIVLGIAGENPAVQQFNPYVFSNTECLSEDNQTLIVFLTEAAAAARNSDRAMAESLNSFIESCQQKLLYSDMDGIANEAALHMDIGQGGYDRVCLVDVLNGATMHAVFSGQMIERTRSRYFSESAAFAAQKDYRLYKLDRWQLAVAVPSYKVSLPDFAEDMKQLQKRLSWTSEEYIPLISVFCVINECAAETMKTVYNAARREMTRKNIQFYICDGAAEKPDEESLRERYHMVNVINYALTHDRVIPYYQGIRDNRTGKIHHYEALMRLADENGRVYPPVAFLDVARSYGLMYDALSMAMMRKVFDAFRDSEENSVSINLGIRDIRNEELTAYIYSFLSTARHPEHFIFEILENEDVDEYETLLLFVNSIHKLGGKISIDDFGSGYSNLQHVVNIPADYLKIDGSIVRECCRNRESENLVALISSWNSLNTRESDLVAEFVENEEIQDRLVRYHIDYSQGYLFSKPSPDLPES